MICCDSQWDTRAMKWTSATHKTVSRFPNKQDMEETEKKPFAWCSKTGRVKQYSKITHMGGCISAEKQGDEPPYQACRELWEGPFEVLMFLAWVMGINCILYSFYTLFLYICCISYTNFSKRNFQNSQPKLLLDEFEVVFFNGLVQFFSGLD